MEKECERKRREKKNKEQDRRKIEGKGKEDKLKEKDINLIWRYLPRRGNRMGISTNDSKRNTLEKPFGLSRFLPKA